MTRMNEVQCQAARSLAVAYHAFMGDLASEDMGGVSVWAGILLKAQIETGVELVKEAQLRHWMRAGEKRAA